MPRSAGLLKQQRDECELEDVVLGRSENITDSAVNWRDVVTSSRMPCAYQGY